MSSADMRARKAAAAAQSAGAGSGSGTSSSADHLGASAGLITPARLPHPPSKCRHAIFRAILAALLTLLTPIWSLWLLLCHARWCCSACRHAPRGGQRISSQPYYQHPELLKRVAALPMAKYWARAEFQRREGYCGCSSVRNVLLSMPSFDPSQLPKNTARGYSNLPTLAKALAAYKQEGSTQEAITSEIYHADEGYSRFLELIMRANDPHYRVIVNFSRTALWGFTQLHSCCSPLPPLLPFHMIYGLIAGHYSPIAGYLPDTEYGPMVAVLDVNESYGLFLVPPRRLYDSVHTWDYFVDRTRGMVVSKVLADKPEEGEAKEATEE